MYSKKGEKSFLCPLLGGEGEEELGVESPGAPSFLPVAPSLPTGTKNPASLRGNTSALQKECI